MYDLIFAGGGFIDEKWLDLTYKSRAEIIRVKPLSLTKQVITFNLEEEGDSIEGEVYISLKQVSENAREYKQDVEIELKRVIIHGLLHLLGYDDQTTKEKKAMTRLEDHYLNQPIVSD